MNFVFLVAVCMSCIEKRRIRISGVVLVIVYALAKYLYGCVPIYLSLVYWIIK